MRSKHSATMLFGVVKGDEQVHRCDVFAAALGGSLLGVTQEPDDVVGEELAIQEEGRDGLAVLLKEQFAELIEQSGKVSAEPRRPLEHTGVRGMKRCGVRTLSQFVAAVCASASRSTRAVCSSRSWAEPAAGQENVVHVSTRFRRGVW